MTTPNLLDDLNRQWSAPLRGRTSRTVWMLLPVAVVVLVWLSGSRTASAEVSETGAFRTDIAVAVPAFHGVTPDLGLSYSSSSGNGWVGVGWSMKGLSTISRVSPSGQGAPQWGGTDVFTLDGRPLVDCTTLPPRPGQSTSCDHPVGALRMYGTQVETFQRFAYDPASDTWTVWRTDGVVAQYTAGQTASRGTASWHLSTVTDRSGNSVHYDWSPQDSNGQVALLQAVRYGDVTVRFQSQSRPDPLTAAGSDTQVVNAARLQAIDITAAGVRVRAYALGYQPGQAAGAPSLLQSVQEFGSDSVVDASGVHGGTYAPATVFTAAPSGAGALTATPPVDVAGWAASWAPGPDDTHRWTSVLNGGDQGAVPYDPGSTASGTATQWLAVDADRDGLSDTVLVSSDKASLRTRIRAELTEDLGVTKDPAGHDVGGFHAVVSADVAWPCRFISQCPTKPPAVHVADVDGDGATDLVLSYTYAYTGSSATVVSVLAGRPDGTFHPLGSPQEIPDGGTLLLGDVNGDSKADLVLVGSGGCRDAVRAGLSDGRGAFDFSPAPACWPADPPAGQAVHYTLADVNGDLRQDVVGVLAADQDKPASTTVAFAAVSVGQGRFQTHQTDTGQHWVGDSTDCNPPRVGFCRNFTTIVPTLWLDADGDGRTDLVVLRPGLGVGTAVAAWTASSRGDGTFSAARAGTTPLPISAIQVESAAYFDGGGTVRQDADDLLTGDVNGDGAGDLIAVGGNRYASHGAAVFRAVSDRHGNWVPGQPTADRSWAGCPQSCWVPAPTVMAGDANGDGLTDVMFAHYSADPAAPGGSWTALDVDPTVSVPALSQLLHGDYNGDGRTDLIYPRRTATGVEVHVLVQRADGTYSAVAPFNRTLPAYTPVHLLQSSWFVADLNGDRQSDLLNLSPGKQVGISLLSLAPYLWYPQIVSAADLNPVVGTPAVWPPGRWSAADVDGDQLDDLVHIGPGPGPDGAPGVLTLLGRHGAGALQMQWSRPAGVADDALADNLNWRVADVDGDGNADLVKADAAGLTVTKLLRRTGSWQVVDHAVANLAGAASAPTATSDAGGDDPAWTAADVNGDGLVDLVRVVATEASGTFVDSLLSNGDGHYTSRGGRLADDLAGGVVAGADVEHWYAVSADGDNRTDLARVFNRGSDLVVQTVTSRGDGTWDFARDARHRPDPAGAACHQRLDPQRRQRKWTARVHPPGRRRDRPEHPRHAVTDRRPGADLGGQRTGRPHRPDLPARHREHRRHRRTAAAAVQAAARRLDGAGGDADRRHRRPHRFGRPQHPALWLPGLVGVAARAGRVDRRLDRRRCGLEPARDHDAHHPRGVPERHRAAHGRAGQRRARRRRLAAGVELRARRPGAGRRAARPADAYRDQQLRRRLRQLDGRHDLRRVRQRAQQPGRGRRQCTPAPDHHQLPVRQRPLARVAGLLERYERSHAARPGVPSEPDLLRRCHRTGLPHPAARRPWAADLDVRLGRQRGPQRRWTVPAPGHYDLRRVRQSAVRHRRERCHLHRHLRRRQPPAPDQVVQRAEPVHPDARALGPARGGSDADGRPQRCGHGEHLRRDRAPRPDHHAVRSRPHDPGSPHRPRTAWSPPAPPPRPTEPDRGSRPPPTGSDAPTAPRPSADPGTPTGRQSAATPTPPTGRRG